MLVGCLRFGRYDPRKSSFQPGRQAHTDNCLRCPLFCSLDGLARDKARRLPRGQQTLADRVSDFCDQLGVFVTATGLVVAERVAWRVEEQPFTNGDHRERGIFLIIALHGACYLSWHRGFSGAHLQVRIQIRILR